MIFYFCALAFLMIFFVELGFVILVSETLENQARDKISLIGSEFEADLQAGADKKVLESGINRNRIEGINIFLFTEEGEMVAPQDYEDYGSVLNEVTARVGQEKVGYSVTYRSGDSVVYASKT